jgi:hypothetical protein
MHSLCASTDPGTGPLRMPPGDEGVAMTTNHVPEFHGAFRRDALYAAGIGDPELRILRHENKMLSFRRGTYVRAAEYYAADDAGKHALQVQSLLVSLTRQNIAASGISAAQIHGLALLDRPGPLLHVVTSDPGVSGVSRDGYVLRTAPLPAEDVCVRHGVRVTTVARTLLDLLCELTFAAGVVACDSALNLKLVTKPLMWDVLDRAGSRPGVETARRVLEFSDGRAESALESASRARLYDEEDIPVPLLQVWVYDDVRVDKFWRVGVGVAGDPDGQHKYLAGGPAQTRAAVEADAVRAARIREKHVHVRWGWHDLDDLPRLAARIRAGFAEAIDRARVV